MAKKMRRRRLTKGPKLPDFVVECIDGGFTSCTLYALRSQARGEAKAFLEAGTDRVRIFHISYELVSDSKRK